MESATDATERELEEIRAEERGKFRLSVSTSMTLPKQNLFNQEFRDLRNDEVPLTPRKHGYVGLMVTSGKLATEWAGIYNEIQQKHKQLEEVALDVLNNVGVTSDDTELSQFFSASIPSSVDYVAGIRNIVGDLKFENIRVDGPEIKAETVAEFQDQLKATVTSIARKVGRLVDISLFGLGDPNGRANAVSKLFPTLAYLLSDIVVYVSSDPFQENSFAQQISRFFEGLQVEREGASPSLILISNKQAIPKKYEEKKEGMPRREIQGDALYELWHPAKITHSYLNNPMPGIKTRLPNGDPITVGYVLQQRFETIDCISFPMYDIDRTKTGGPSGDKLFERLVFDYQQILGRIILSKYKNRVEKKIKVSEGTFVRVLGNYIASFPNDESPFPETMPSLVRYYYNYQNDIPSKASDMHLLFCSLFEKVNSAAASRITIVQVFSNLAKFTVHCLALRDVIEGREKWETPDQITVKDVGAEFEFLQERIKACQSLIELIFNSLPCIAIYDHMTKTGVYSLRCTTLPDAHGNKHWVKTNFYFPGEDWSLIPWAFRKLLGKIGWTYNPSWRGNHQPCDSKKFTDEYPDLLVSQQDLLDLYKASYNLAKSWTDRFDLQRHLTTLLALYWSSDINTPTKRIEEAGTQVEKLVCPLCLKNFPKGREVKGQFCSPECRVAVLPPF